MGCKAEGFGILGWPPPQKKAPSFRNENKYDIWTDKLIEMLPFIYSLITPWFYGENKKSYLRNNYRFLIWLYSKLDWGGGVGKATSFEIKNGSGELATAYILPLPYEF